VIIDMFNSSEFRYISVWLFLLVLTLVTLWFGTGHGAEDIKYSSTVALLIGLAKVGVVGSVFMHVGNAPLPIKIILYGWCLILSVVLCSIYLLK